MCCPNCEPEIEEEEPIHVPDWPVCEEPVEAPNWPVRKEEEVEI